MDFFFFFSSRVLVILDIKFAITKFVLTRIYCIVCRTVEYCITIVLCDVMKRSSPEASYGRVISSVAPLCSATCGLTDGYAFVIRRIVRGSNILCAKFNKKCSYVCMLRPDAAVSLKMRNMHALHVVTDKRLRRGLVIVQHVSFIYKIEAVIFAYFSGNRRYIAWFARNVLDSA